MKKLLEGYRQFRQQYATGDQSVMHHLSTDGQNPRIMMVACCDSRVDPSLILGCDPGELFVVRNIANIVPPYECDENHHGTSAALEFGIRILEVNSLIILGHSQCGGIETLVKNDNVTKNDFISNWMSLIQMEQPCKDVNTCAKNALNLSYQNCLTFPWIHERVKNKTLSIHRWFFDIQSGEIFVYSESTKKFLPLTENPLNG